MIRKRLNLNIYLATFIQLLVILFLLWMMRLVFYFYNASNIGPLDNYRWFLLLKGGMRFDVNVVCLFNCPFIIMRLLPLGIVFNKTYEGFTKLIFCIINITLLLLNWVDIPLFSITGSRLTHSIITEFLREPNIFTITLSFWRSYWWVFISSIFIIFFVVIIAYGIKPLPLTVERFNSNRIRLLKYGMSFTGLLLTSMGIWGRPLTDRRLDIEHAKGYISRLSQINVVLNTPFCMFNIEDDYHLRKYNFFETDELSKIRNSVHLPHANLTPTNKNIVILTIESAGSLWHKDLTVLDHPPVENLTPFLDSLISESLSFKHAIATSVLTIDGVRNIYGGIPAYGFFMMSNSACANTKINGIAGLLSKIGYDNKFYLGSLRDSFSIYDFLRESGFNQVTDNATLPKDKADNSVWGYWDHLLFQFAANDIQNLKEPFVVGLLTLNPHEPFEIPSNWKSKEYKNPKGTYERALEYEDMCLREFFNEAKKHSWFDNTLFVITGDHGARYKLTSDLGTSYIQPHILFSLYDPSNNLPRGIIEKTIGQADIMPSLLYLLGYDQPYVAVGTNIFSEEHSGYAFNCNFNSYQVISNRYLVMMNDKLDEIEAVFDVAADIRLEYPLTVYDTKEVAKMVRWAQALNQDFTQRMFEDRMTY